MQDVAFSEIESNPAILGGKPCIRGTRLSVEFILELVASGADIAAISREFPEVSPEAAQQAVLYAARSIDNEVLIAVKAAG